MYATSRPGAAISPEFASRFVTNPVSIDAILGSIPNVWARMQDDWRAKARTRARERRGHLLDP